MFLLFLTLVIPFVSARINLHSNMLLLFRCLMQSTKTASIDLHSNMFLLFLNTSPAVPAPATFTFQYVSIISDSGSGFVTLFSVIYIPICFYYFKSKLVHYNDVCSFTFQYVSIISVSRHIFLRSCH